MVGGVGCDEVGWGGVEGGKNLRLGHPMSSHEAHTVADDTPVGHIVSGRLGANPGPTAQLAPSMGVIVPVVTFEGQQNTLQKSRPVNI